MEIGIGIIIGAFLIVFIIGSVATAVSEGVNNAQIQMTTTTSQLGNVVTTTTVTTVTRLLQNPGSPQLMLPPPGGFNDAASILRRSLGLRHCPNCHNKTILNGQCSFCYFMSEGYEADEPGFAPPPLPPSCPVCKGHQVSLKDGYCGDCKQYTIFDANLKKIN